MAMNLHDVVKDYIVPLLEELGKQERNFKGFLFGFLSEYNSNGHFLHEDENNEHGTENKGRSALKSKKMLFINLKKETLTKVKISLKKYQIICVAKQVFLHEEKSVMNAVKKLYADAIRHER